MRPYLLVFHRYGGLLMAGFLIVAGLTGALLAFNHEIDEWFNRDWMHVTPQNSPIISLNEISGIVQKNYPGYQVEFISLKRDPSESFNVRIGPSLVKNTNKAPHVNQLFINPYTGQILGARENGAFDLSPRGLMPFLFNLHHTLYMPDKLGRWLLGGIAIIWLFDSFVGLYLTLPKGSIGKDKDYFRRWLPSWKIKRGNSVRMNFDIHRASGLWFWPILIVTAFTSIYFNLNKEVYRPVLGSLINFSTHPVDKLPKVTPKLPNLNFDEAFKLGLELRPQAAVDFPISYISYSQKQNLYRISFDERDPNSWFKYKREQVFFDGDNGELKAIWGHSNSTPGDKFNSWQFPLHTGQMFGLPGRIIILLTGLLTAVLSVTGVVIWYKKKISKSFVRQFSNLNAKAI